MKNVQFSVLRHSLNPVTCTYSPIWNVWNQSYVQQEVTSPKFPEDHGKKSYIILFSLFLDQNADSHQRNLVKKKERDCCLRWINTILILINFKSYKTNCGITPIFMFILFLLPTHSSNWPWSVIQLEDTKVFSNIKCSLCFCACILGVDQMHVSRNGELTVWFWESAAGRMIYKELGILFQTSSTDYSSRTHKGSSPYWRLEETPWYNSRISVVLSLSFCLWLENQFAIIWFLIFYWEMELSNRIAFEKGLNRKVLKTYFITV